MHREVAICFASVCLLALVLVSQPLWRSPPLIEDPPGGPGGLISSANASTD